MFYNSIQILMAYIAIFLIINSSMFSSFILFFLILNSIDKF